MDMAEQDTPLHRPIPRRPFPFTLASPTPPLDASDDCSSNSGLSPTVPHFLQTFNNNDVDTPRTPSSPALTRSGSSFFNLHKVNLSLSLGVPTSSFSRSSTLGGIFSPSMTSTDNFVEDPQSLHDAGSQTPIWRSSVDDATYEVIKKRSNLRYQHMGTGGLDVARKPVDTSSYYNDIDPVSDSTTPNEPEGNRFSSLSVTFRVAVLFVLGAAYGNVLFSLHATRVVGTLNHSIDWNYLGVWGCVGVALGIMLPWFDCTWDSLFGEEDLEYCRTTEELSRDPDTLKEWTLAIRSIATFVGIVFAIRRLPWDSTLQASICLALVNPFLWYIIDRSMPGFVLSTLMGTIGTVFLMGVDPSIMPTPLAPAKLVANFSSPVSNLDDDDLIPFVLRTASVSTTETVVWMVSVLFCCSLCFGNIGRRMSLSQGAVTKGRWQMR